MKIFWIRFYKVLTVVYHTQGYWHFGSDPSSGIVKNTKDRNVSETGSVSVLREGVLGPLESANPNHCAQQSGVSPLVRMKQIQFPKHCVL
jgi:hypothetical protein